MILVDANLLIYASIPRFPEHDPARRWLEEQLQGTTRVGLPWPSLLAFLRIVTNARVFGEAVSREEAWDQIERWLTAPPVWIPAPTVHHAEILGDLVLGDGAGGDLVPDAHLAALAIEHGLTLCSTDRDFARFTGLRFENPLARPGTVRSPARRYSRSTPARSRKSLPGRVTAS